MLKLSKGSSFLLSFLDIYIKDKRHKDIIKEHPVIILFDNDSGAKGAYTKIKELMNLDKPYTPEKPYYKHVKDNLYVGFTPKNNSCINNSCIEDFIKINGKEFKVNITPANKDKKIKKNTTIIMDDKEYSKFKFSQYVLKEWKKLDIETFTPILKIFAGIMQDYEKQKKEN